MNLAYLERQLRAGKHPSDFGAVVIGQGVQKEAYCIGNLVIKENTGGYRSPDERRLPLALRKLGYHPVRQYKCGKWILQEKVTPFVNDPLAKQTEAYKLWHSIQYKGGYDTHDGNCGYDSQGRLVCFDW